MPRRAFGRTGFTMVELTVSLVVMSVVLLACGSVVVLASRALTNSVGGGGAQAVSARGVVDRVTADLRTATAFTERAATAVTFTVPDRTGDGQPETIRYAWSGAGGASVSAGGTTYAVAAYTLTRQFNGGPPAAVAEDVRAFNFNYLVRTIGQPAPAAAVESGSQTLSSHNGGTGSNVKAFDLKAANWPAEYFLPSWPANTTSWKITRVQVQIARDSLLALGTVTVEVRAADSAGLPSPGALASASVDVTLLPLTATWVDLPLSTPLAGLDPAQGICLVLSTTAVNPAKVYYDKSSAAAALSYSTTTDGGVSWKGQTSANALQFGVTGTYTTQAPAVTVAEALPDYQ